MHVCYIDESGDLGALPAEPAPNGNDQPVFVIAGLILDVARLEQLTNSFLDLKYRFFPGLNYPSQNHLDRIIPEVKGAHLRRDATRGSRNERRHAFGFLDQIVALLELHHVRIIGRVWVKGLGEPFNGVAVYTSSVQILYTHFDHFLDHEASDLGFCIADSRNKPKNVNVAHSIFTQKFQASTSLFSRVLELPTFGHSDNHACLQACDIVSSAILFPIACFEYCTGHVANIHVQPNAADIKLRYGQRLKKLQYRYQDPSSGAYKGGIVVSDPIGAKSSALMFR